MMNRTALILALFFFVQCTSSNHEKKNTQQPISDQKQAEIFLHLANLTGKDTALNTSEDTLAFLILPLDASCSSCRDKTIDSIIKRADSLNPNHHIIVSTEKGIKNTINYFEKDGFNFPIYNEHVFLDSNNIAFRKGLYIDNPAMYYAAKGKVYKSVLSHPSTIKQDLREFFSGTEME